MIANIRKTRTGDRDLQVVQDSVFQCLENIRRREILDGRLIKDVSVNNTTLTEVAHGLGRPLNGWLVTRINADARVWEAASSKDTLLTLDSSANATIDLWVF